MNEAHLHLVVNHFPIIGTILGLGILVVGLSLKNNSVKNTAFFLFIVAAIFAAVSMGTGEGAEELVEDMPSIGHDIIHEHEEMAEKLAIALYVLAATSLLALYLYYKKSVKSTLIAYVALVIAAVAVYLGQQTGTTGGEIRHTEIRSVAIPSDVQMEDKD